MPSKCVRLPGSCPCKNFAQKGRFETVDITGGAPELNPNLVPLIEKVSPSVRRVMLRSNLKTFTDGKRDSLMDFCKELQVVIVASFPFLDPVQTESQRGKEVFEKSLAALQKLNSLGYGHKGSGLELNLVSNPAGAFLHPPRAQAEKRFRFELKGKWGSVPIRPSEA